MLTSYFKRYRTEIVVAFLLIFLYLFTRLVRLSYLPIFVDEAIYLRWAQIAKNDASWRFISLTDGKQPLFVWLIMILMKFVSEPLVAGRLASVLSGFISLVGVWSVSYLLFKNKRLSFFASGLYAVIPFYLVYDRMALMDATVAAFCIWSIFLEILLVKELRLDVALILGAVLGGGVLTKTSGFFNIYLLPFSLLLFDWRHSQWQTRLLKWFLLAGLAAIISQAFYSILRLTPFFHIIAQKNILFVFPFAEWMKDPFYYSLSNLRGLADWLVRYLTWPLVVLVVFSFILSRKETDKKLFLLSWFLVPFLALAVFGRILYPRFVLFMSLPLLVLAAWSLDKIFCQLKNKLVQTIICLLILILPLSVDYHLLTKPAQASIPQPDQDQYISSWPAGYGITEMIEFLKSEAKNKKIFLATEGTFGLLPASFELYLWNNQNVEIKGYFPVKEIPPEVMGKAQIMPTFFVFNETKQVPGNWPLELIAKYPRPDPCCSMRIYRVLANQLHEKK